MVWVVSLLMNSFFSERETLKPPVRELKLELLSDDHRYLLIGNFDVVFRGTVFEAVFFCEVLQDCGLPELADH